MGFTLACRDAGIDCDYVSKGETKEELMQNASKHGKEVHGYTDEELQNPEMMNQMEEVVKEE